MNRIFKLLFSSLLLVWVLTGPALAQQADALPLAEKGPYPVGTRDMTFMDERRDGREIEVTLWYPAMETAENAAPDLSNAPYPLILYSHGHGGNRMELAYLTRHLASYGFVAAAMEQKGHGGRFVLLDVVDQSMDVLFVLNQLASLSEGDLVGVFDSDNTGVAGYSGGGYDAIMVSGARWDDTYHWEWCAEHPGVYPQACTRSEQIYAYRAQFEPLPVQGELWQPLSDERIKAVLPLTGGPGLVFGERGLATATVPMLLIAGTADTVAPYEWAGVFVYEHWGGDERFLISIMGADHLFGYGSSSLYASVVEHFATAFFGYYLQGHEDYAQYLTEAYINSIDRLAWGPYGMETSMLGTVPITPENAGQLSQIAVLPDADGIEMANSFSVVWSPDGRLIAGGSGDRVNLWDATTGELLAELDGQIGFVNSVAFSPDGQIIAAAGGCYEPIQHGVQLWDVASQEPLLRLEDFDDTVFGVAFSPDGKTLLTGGGNAWGFGPGSAQLWDVITGEMLHEFGLPNQYDPSTMMTVYNIAFSTDGTLAAAIMGDGRVQVCEVDTGTERVVLIGHEGWGNSVAFSPDGTLLATASAANFSDQGGDARLWDVTTGKQVATLEGHTGSVKSITFSPDGKMVASASADGTVRLWDTATAQVLAVLDVPGAYSVAFSPDGTMLATDGWDGVNTIRLWAVPG